MTIKIINGCLLDALDKGEITVAAHCANMQHTFGSGIAKSIKERYPQAYEADYLWSISDRKGSHSLAMLPGNKFIANLYGQVNYGREKRQVHYGLIAKALYDLSKRCDPGLNVGFPYLMGCDRAGGDWQVMCEHIETFFGDCNVNIYKLEQSISSVKEHGTWPAPKGWRLVPENMDATMLKAFVEAAPNPEKWLAPNARYNAAVSAAPVYKKE